MPLPRGLLLPGPSRYGRVPSITGAALNPLYGAVRSCQACPLHLSCTAPVPGVGDAAGVAVMVVLEGPGVTEDREGIPVTGATWDELEPLLRLAGLSRDTIWLSNAVKCAVPSPSWRDAETCFPLWFPAEIELVRPRVIVACGQLAIRRILDNPRATVEETHGRLYAKDYVLSDGFRVESWVLPSYHPAAVFYDPGVARWLREDFALLGKVKTGKLPPGSFQLFDIYASRERYEGRPLEREDCDAIKAAGWCAVDVEVVNDAVWCASFSWQAGEAVVVGAADLSTARRLLDGSFKVDLVFHNALYDVPRLQGAGFTVDLPRVHDTLWMARLLQLESHGLKELSTRLLGMEMRSYSEVVASAQGSHWLERVAVFLLSFYRAACSLPDPAAVVETVWEKGACTLSTRVRRPQRLDRKLVRLHRDWVDGKLAAEHLAKRWANLGALGEFPAASLADVHPEVATYYSGRDADSTGRLYQLLPDRLRSEGLWDAYLNDIGSLPLLVGMSLNGIGVDSTYLKSLAVDLGWRQAALEAQMFKQTGIVFNPASDGQLGYVLYDVLKLPVHKITRVRRAPSTDDGILTRIRHLHPVVDLAVRWRQLDKARSTYCEGLPRHVAADGRIHCDLSGSTVTGRIAARGPNLLAIPHRTELGREVRRGIIP